MILYRFVLILFIGWVFGEDKDVFISREIILISRSDWICLVRIFVHIYIYSIHRYIYIYILYNYTCNSQEPLLMVNDRPLPNPPNPPNRPTTLVQLRGHAMKHKAAKSRRSGGKIAGNQGKSMAVLVVFSKRGRRSTSFQTLFLNNAVMSFNSLNLYPFFLENETLSK